MMKDIVNMALENLDERYCFNYVAKAANGAVLYQNGGSVILASVCAGEVIEAGDFVPLGVQYIEKAYASGKIPSGFIKREGKPSEFEVLTSRLIDRTLRPLFPKNYHHNTTIITMVLSYDNKSDLALNALNAAAAALFVSNVPLPALAESCVCGVRIGRIDNAFIINPTKAELESSELDLFVSGRGEELLMIEMKSKRTESGANELDEALMLEALNIAKAYIKNATQAYAKAFKPYKKQGFTPDSSQDNMDEAMAKKIATTYHSDILSALSQMAKSESKDALQSIINKASMEQGLDKAEAERYVLAHKRFCVRDMILQTAKRADGRGLKDVRDISIESNILPFVHGSILFARGQTQALVSATLGGESDAQSYDMIGEKLPQKRRFLFHYNFPDFSVGEAGMIGSIGRRELGHGSLARNALESSIKPHNKTIRLVSEILESNGSSSMASVCGGSLALCACGMEVDSLIAGVAMGLVSENGKYAILTDISGLEDHDGDMDFKVAGGYKGISAMQMDIKLGGISHELLSQALYQAKEAREHILSIMEEAKARIVLNMDILPKSESFHIPPHKVAEVIGAGGKVIREIIERFCVSIDLARDSGLVTINASELEPLRAAKAHILNIVGGSGERVQEYSVGERFSGRIKNIVDFGVFIELPKGGDGLIHISKFNKPREVPLSAFLGDTKVIECEIVSINKGKVELGLC